MNGYWADLVIIGIIVLSVLTGFIRGLIKEIIAVCIWVLAIWCAYNYSFLLMPWLSKHIQDQAIAQLVAFISLLISILLAGGLINTLIGFILRRSGLSTTDRLLGMAFGFVRGIFIVALIITVVKMTFSPAEQYLEASQLYFKFNPLVAWLYQFTPQVIQKVKILVPKEKVIDFTLR